MCIRDRRTIFAAPQSETLSAWERLADDDEPFDDGEPLDDLPDDVTEQALSLIHI